jgi:hypothetical protein
LTTKYGQLRLVFKTPLPWEEKTIENEDTNKNENKEKLTTLKKRRETKINEEDIREISKKVE